MAGQARPVFVRLAEPPRVGQLFAEWELADSFTCLENQSSDCEPRSVIPRNSSLR